MPLTYTVSDDGILSFGSATWSVVRAGAASLVVFDPSAAVAKCRLFAGWYELSQLMLYMGMNSLPLCNGNILNISGTLSTSGGGYGSGRVLEVYRLEYGALTTADFVAGANIASLGPRLAYSGNIAANGSHTLTVDQSAFKNALLDSFNAGHDFMQMVVVFQNQRTDIAPTDEWSARTSAAFTIEFTNHRVFCHV